VRRPVNSEMINKIKNMKNRIFAMPAAALTSPPNPKTAATIATTRKIRAQCNIVIPPFNCGSAGVAA
jgi:hypothetical protein